MNLERLPSQAAWHHWGIRCGFETAFFESHPGGSTIRGNTSAWEAEAAWSVGYVVQTDSQWRTLTAEATVRALDGDLNTMIQRLEGDSWNVDGTHRPDLTGCVDIDFESSVVTNTLPIHRLEFATGAETSVPAAFVRADDLRVQRLEQSYRHLTATPTGHIFEYRSSTFDFACTLEFDRSGLVVDYPEIGRRFNP